MAFFKGLSVVLYIVLFAAFGYFYPTLVEIFGFPTPFQGGPPTYALAGGVVGLVVGSFDYLRRRLNKAEKENQQKSE